MTPENNTLDYLHRRQWTWVPVTRLAECEHCSITDIHRTLNASIRSGAIEYVGNGNAREYRWIGGLSNPKRIIVEMLRNVYPMAVSAAQIQSSTGVYNAPGWIRSYIDLIPVESFMENGCRMYRYVAGDRRSLVDMPAEPKRKVKVTVRKTKKIPKKILLTEYVGKKIVEFLQDHDDWYTAKHIASEIGGNSLQVSYVIMHLNNDRIETCQQDNEPARYHYAEAS